MEKAKISSYQLFVLILLFELGSALLLPLAMDAKQDAWIAVLFGMIGGMMLFIIFFRLYLYYPDKLPTMYAQIIVGKLIGKVIAFLYILYFAYLAARILRDFGVMLVTFAYPETPLFIVNALLIIVVVYAVRKGIEVLGRTGELLFSIMYLLAVTGFILIVISGLIDVNNLKPILGEGILPVLKATFIQTLYFPFGETIVFAMIFPYLNHSRKAQIAGLCAIGLSGINLALVMLMNISVLGVNLTSRAPFPLLATIQMIQVAEFIERLDIFFMLALIIGGFFKIGIFFYAVVTGVANLFSIDSHTRLCFPMALVVLLLSITMASSFAEHVQEGYKFVPMFLHVPFQIIIPVTLLGIAMIRRRRA
ncbi:GerAB/ArcD/ProY family transporter [Fredinandcohnia onubensis]|uniref:GerAB/ArcD/ProY family transporter n=1 Tax=Fredinandcohnia onubensis TaxID=1571209 RepID=UPI000C0BF1AF|nr:GerAB/ArcD/ProY family transporter [Fredinandcohnia onubensis]